MDRICVEGFPRSGNTFFSQVLNVAFPDVFITPFSHSATTLTPEHFVLIRNPRNSISSFMSVFAESNQTASEQWWIRFYRTVQDKIDNSRWIFFDDLVFDTDQTINKMSNILNIQPKQIDYSSFHTNKALKPYVLRSFDKAEKLYLELCESIR